MTPGAPVVVGQTPRLAGASPGWATPPPARRAAPSGAASSSTALALPQPRVLETSLALADASVRPAGQSPGWSRIDAETKKARIAVVRSVSRETVDDLDETAGAEVAAEAAWVLDDPPLEDVDAERLKANRLSELDAIDSFHAYEAVSEEEAAGKFLTMRWVDTDEKSRVVVREFASTKRDDLFAAASTPTTHLVVDMLCCIFLWSRAIGDITRAFLHVFEDELVFARPPAEWLEREQEKAKQEGHSWTPMVWKLLRVFYGRRKAARAWVEHLATLLVGKCGLERSASAPQFFRLPGQERPALGLEVHMDDLHIGGHFALLERLGEQLGEHLRVKAWVIFPFGRMCLYTHLRRERRLTATACYIKPNPSHIQRCAELLGVSEGKGADTPLKVDDRGEEPTDAKQLDNEATPLYRRIVGILLHVVCDRGDLAYFVRIASQRLREPTEASMARLRRGVKYAFATRFFELVFPFWLGGGAPSRLELWSDSDWAGDTVTRKSASCGVIAVGGCHLAVIARGQHVISHSSCEAEFYAAVMTVAEGAHLQEVCAWFGLVLRMTLDMDSSAARRALSRDGVGRMRHMAVKTLWVQQLVKQGALLVGRIPGEDNPADIGAKPLPAARFAMLRGAIGIQLIGGAFANGAVAVRRQSEQLTQRQAEQCQVENLPRDADSLAQFMIFLVGLSAGILAVALLICCCRRRWPQQRREEETQTDPIVISGRSLNTQSQATYERGRDGFSIGRFHAFQRDRDHGAWVERYHGARECARA